MKRLLFLMALVAGVLVLKAEPIDSIQVNVRLEVVLPDTIMVLKDKYVKAPEQVGTVLTPAVPVYNEAAEPIETIRVVAEIDTVAYDIESVGDSIVTLKAVPHPVFRKTGTPDPRRVNFSWGADFGSSIDLSAHDMSSIDFSAYFGLRYRWLDFAGVGASANIMVSNSCRSYPLFALVRTDFSNFMKVAFLELRGGVTMNYLPDNASQTAPYGSVSVGFNLARSNKFRSYVTAGYTFLGRKNVHGNYGLVHYDSRQMACIRLGVSF